MRSFFALSNIISSDPLLLAVFSVLAFVLFFYGSRLFLWAFCECNLLLIHLESFVLWLVAKAVKPRYQLLGSCQKRGTCCRHIVFEPPQWLLRQSLLLKLCLLYHRLCHGFYVYARKEDKAFVMYCMHLQQDGRCGIYRYRPRLCRQYPRLYYFKPPGLLPGCGYRVQHKSVASMKKNKGLPIVNEQELIVHETPVLTEDQKAILQQLPKGVGHSTLFDQETDFQRLDAS